MNINIDFNFLYCANAVGDFWVSSLGHLIARLLSRVRHFEEPPFGLASLLINELNQLKAGTSTWQARFAEAWRQVPIQGLIN